MNFTFNIEKDKTIEVKINEDGMSIDLYHRHQSEPVASSWFTPEDLKSMVKPTFFKITAVHREDLEVIGFDTSEVSDQTMKQLADKMKSAYLENGFWIDLPIIAEHLNIPKKEDN